MRWYAAIHGLEEFDTVDQASIPPGTHRFDGLSEALMLLDRFREGKPFEGVYYGNEFCERLLPRNSELAAALEKAERSGASLILLTPYLTDRGIDDLIPLLDMLSGVKGAEVVLNDWGAVRIVRENYPGIIPVAGRLLSRMLKEVRIASYLRPGKAPPGALEALRDCGYSNPDYDEILRYFGIRRVELDIPPQGLGVHVGEGVSVDVHVPFSYVTSGRNCMPGSLHAAPKDKFTPFAPCTRECTRWTLRLRQGDGAAGDPLDDPLLLQRGNTVFFLQGISLMEEVFTRQTADGIDRVVVEVNLLSRGVQ